MASGATQVRLAKAQGGVALRHYCGAELERLVSPSTVIEDCPVCKTLAADTIKVREALDTALGHIRVLVKSTVAHPKHWARLRAAREFLDKQDNVKSRTS